MADYITNKKKLLFKFIKYKAFNLIGISSQIKNSFDYKKNQCNDEDKKKGEVTECVVTLNDKTFFGLLSLKEMMFYIEYKLNNETIQWLNSIISSFDKVINNNKELFSNLELSEYYDITEYDRDYILLEDSYTSKYESELFSFIIEKGIINWVLPSISKSQLKMERLFSILEDWSKRTYEGHNVCYGVLINTSENEYPKFNRNIYFNSFLDFLDDEYSATLSDGISSLFELNSNCELIDYISLTKNNKIEECNFDDSVLPYRFIQIIKTYVTSNKVGIFLLQKGDIIIAKDQKIMFIKRNGKWLNFQYNSFENIVKDAIKKDTKTISKLLQNCFATCIDVSLSHTGGIIALVPSENYKDVEKKSSRIDLLLNNSSEENLYYDEIKNQLIMFLKKEQEKCSTNEIDNKISLIESIEDYSKENKALLDKMFIDDYGLKKNLKDIRKRLTKRHYIVRLLQNGDNYKKYYEIDRKLRAELTGMDGASIINDKAEIISFGAIIENEPGSSGGGRGAAAKLLSKFGGFAIKISTDGYIEVFVKGNKIYEIK